MMSEEKVKHSVFLSPLVRGEMQEGGVGEQHVSYGTEPLRFVHEHPLPYRSWASTGRPSATDPLTKGRRTENSRIGVIIVTWNSEKFIPALLESLQKVNYPRPLWRVFFVDNGSEDGTIDLLCSHSGLDSESRQKNKQQKDFFSFGFWIPAFPPEADPPWADAGMTRGEAGMTEKVEVELLCNEKNVGFAKACNQGAEAALQWGAEYLYFLNPDTEVDKDFLREALNVMLSSSKHDDSSVPPIRQAQGDTGSIGQVQSLTLREGGTEVQSWGNSLTFLGFGYSGGDGASIEEFERECGTHPYTPPEEGTKSPLERGADPPAGGEAGCVTEIGYASGAAMMVPAKVWKEVGGFDEIYESFHEDTDLSLKIRLAGYRIVLAPMSKVIHKYQFARSIKNYYYMERNRYILGLKFFKMPTLILFLPAFIIMEAGTLGYSLVTGFWKEKLKAYLWLIFYLEKVWARRLTLQHLRKKGDHELVKYLVAKVEFQEVMNPILEYIVNPVMEVYWKAVRGLIRW